MKQSINNNNNNNNPPLFMPIVKEIDNPTIDISKGSFYAKSDSNKTINNIFNKNTSKSNGGDGSVTFIHENINQKKLPKSEVSTSTPPPPFITNSEINYIKFLSADILLALLPIVNIVKGIYDIIVNNKLRQSINTDVNDFSVKILAEFSNCTKTPVLGRSVKNRMIQIDLENMVVNWKIAKGIAEIVGPLGIILFTLVILVAKSYKVQPTIFQPTISPKMLIMNIELQIRHTKEEIEILNDQKTSTEDNEFSSKMDTLNSKLKYLTEQLDIAKPEKK